MMNTGIVLFTYNRPDRTGDLLESLTKDHACANLELMVFCDHYEQNPAISEEIFQVIRKYESRFAGVEFDLASENRGLSKQIISGVTKAFQKYDALVILEDDLVMDKNAVTYFLSCLERYEGDDRIFSINGYSPITEVVEPSLFLTSRLSPWGWATWKDKWLAVDWDKEMRISDLNLRRVLIDGIDLLRMITATNRGKIDSWAIRAYCHQNRGKLLSVCCTHSFVMNNGFGANSTHTKRGEWRYKTEFIDKNFKALEFPQKLDFSMRLNWLALKPTMVWNIILGKVI